jgi:putative peptidoglycan lipid II flippase
VSADLTQGGSDVRPEAAEISRGPLALRQATVLMALGTGFSRLTGVLRVVALAAALGTASLGDAFNLANTTPNMLYDVVLGGILSATFIPVFVDRLSTRTEREAWRSISAIITISGVVLLGATVVFWFFAPALIDGLTALNPHATAAQATAVHLQRTVSISLLRWFVPQVAFYGFIAMATALLNTRRRFVAPTWVPIANNLVCIVVLVWFAVIAGSSPTTASVAAHHGQIVLLGLGTTLGVALQASLLVPSLRRSKLDLLRWRFAPGDDAVRTVLRLSGWTFGFVLANQIALYIVLALAGKVGPGTVSSYTYAYTFLQMPFAVVTVSIMSAVTPDLAKHWATGDVVAFKHRLATGLRAMLAIIIPAAVGMLLLARPAVGLLLGHGHTSTAEASDQTGAALAMFALGLPGFCTFLYVVRVLQSMQRARTAFWLYLVENGINVLLALILIHPFAIRGLALSLSVAYTVAAVIGLAVLRGWLGALGSPRLWAPLRRVGVATAVMAVAVLIVSSVFSATSGTALIGRVLASVAVGLIAFGGTAVILANRPGTRRSPLGQGRR